MKIFRLSLLLLALTAMAGCIKDAPRNIEVDIEEVVFGNAEGVLNVSYGHNSIEIYVDAARVDRSDMQIGFRCSEGASISPDPATVTDYTSPRTFVLVSEDGAWTKKYSVSVQAGQLPDRFDFEQWYSPERAKYMIPVETITEEEESYPLYMWACANEAYAFAVDKNADYRAFPTQPAYDTPQSGRTYVLLRTQSTGDFARPIASGSLYIGQFDASQLDPLHSTRFGLPFRNKPLSVKGWYRYRSAGLTPHGGVDDRGKITAVLYKTDETTSFLDGYTVKDSKNIVGRADLLTEPTAGDEWVRFEIDFNYTAEVDPGLLREGGYNLSLSFASSVNGNEYDGAIGSELHIDDVEVVCDEEF